MSNPLDLEIYGYRHIQHDGDELHDRETTDFIGVGWTIADDAAGDGKTKIELSGDFGAANLITTGYIARGANPANEGGVRLTAGDAIVWNAAGTPVQGLKIDGSGSVFVGDTDASEIRYDTDALGNHTFRINATPVLTLEHNLTTIAQPIAIGAAPATGGAVNLTNNEGIYGKDVAGNSARLLLLDGSDYEHVGDDTHVDLVLIGATQGVNLKAGGVAELKARPGYVGLGSGALASVGTGRLEKDAAWCLRNNADTDDICGFRGGAADDNWWIGGTHGTADRPDRIIVDATTEVKDKIAGTDRYTVAAAHYIFGASAACSATGTHRHEDNVSYRWQDATANDRGAFSWADTIFTIGGANPARPTWIYADASSGVALDIAGTTVLQCQAALIAVNQDLRAAAAKDIDCYTNGGYLKPRYTAQNGIVAPDLGETMNQKDTTAGRWYIVVETPDGTKKVEVT